MRTKHFIVLSLSFIYLVSCSETKNSTTKPTPQTIEVKDTTTNHQESSFKDSLISNHNLSSDSSQSLWKSLTNLKQQTITDLSQNNDNTCQILQRFINDYDQKISSLDPLNINSNEANNYVSFQSSEGEQYIVMNPQFLSSKITEHLSPTYKKYLQAYCQELKHPCCSDASLLLTTDELFYRAKTWATLTTEISDDICQTESKSNYKSYLSFIMEGLDNTPSFDFQTGIYSKEYIQNLDETIKNDSTSLINKDFTSFKQQLKRAEFKKTDSLSLWIKNYLNQ